MILFRLIIIFLICYIVITALKSIFSQSRIRSADRKNFSEDSEEMVFDPQCRSYVPKSDAIVSEVTAGLDSERA